MLKQIYANLHGIPTKIAVARGNLECKPEKLILVIPGNPGASSMYEDFISDVDELLRHTVSVWCISHLGHDPANNYFEKTLPTIEDNGKLYSLDGQTSHKIDFIQVFVPKSCQLTLIGHSIGAKIVLDVMTHFKRHQPERNIQGYLLFPMIERMMETPSGRTTYLCTNYLQTVTVAISRIVDLMPASLKSLFFRLFVDAETKMTNKVMEIINPWNVKQILFLAQTEMRQVKELDITSIVEHQSKLRVYYGVDDGWCPVSFYHIMAEKFPSLRTDLCQKNIPHAFVLKHSADVAKIVADWYMNDCGKE